MEETSFSWVKKTLLGITSLICLIAEILIRSGEFRYTAILLAVTVAAFLMNFGKPGFLLSLCFITILFFFSLCFFYASHTYIPFDTKEITAIEGTLEEDPSWFGSGTMELKIRVAIFHSSSGAAAGGKAMLVYRVPPSVTGSPDISVFRGTPVLIKGLSFSSTAWNNGVSGYGGAVSFGRITGLYRWRSGFFKWFRQKSAGLGTKGEILLPALLWGLDHPGKPEVSAFFRSSGTAHIMALSGFHAGLVGLLLFLSGRLLLGKRGGLFFSLAGLAVYLWLTGFKPSLTRAVFMYGIFCWGTLLHIRLNPWAVLLFTYILTSLVFPLSTVTLSSQLSYLALAGIIGSSKRINTLLFPRLPGWIRLPLSVSAGAQLWTSVLVLKVFGEMSSAGLAASFLLTPLVTLYMYAGVVWILIPSCDVVNPLFFRVAELLESLIFHTAQFFSEFPTLKGSNFGPVSFLLFLIPVLLLEFYCPGREYGKGKTGFKLRFGFRNKSPFGYDGTGAP